MSTQTDPLNLFLTVLAADGPRSAALEPLLNSIIKTQTPDKVEKAVAALRDKMLSAATPGTASPPAAETKPMWPWWLLAAFGVGGGVGGGATWVFPKLGDFEWSKYRFDVPSTFWFFVVIALIGLVAGIAYSVYHNGWKLNLPSLPHDKKLNSISFRSLGFLDEALMGAIAAVLTVYNAHPPVAEGSTYPFYGSIISSAAIAGFVGARMRTGIGDRDLLKTTLIDVMGKPAVTAERQLAAKNAPTAQATAKIAADSEPTALAK